MVNQTNGCAYITESCAGFATAYTVSTRGTRLFPFAQHDHVASVNNEGDKVNSFFNDGQTQSVLLLRTSTDHLESEIST